MHAVQGTVFYATTEETVSLNIVHLRFEGAHLLGRETARFECVAPAVFSVVRTRVARAGVQFTLVHGAMANPGVELESSLPWPAECSGFYKKLALATLVSNRTTRGLAQLNPSNLYAANPDIENVCGTDDGSDNDESTRSDRRARTLTRRQEQIRQQYAAAIADSGESVLAYLMRWFFTAHCLVHCEGVPPFHVLLLYQGKTRTPEALATVSNYVRVPADSLHFFHVSNTTVDEQLKHDPSAEPLLTVRLGATNTTVLKTLSSADPFYVMALWKKRSDFKKIVASYKSKLPPPLTAPKRNKKEKQESKKDKNKKEKKRKREESPEEDAAASSEREKKRARKQSTLSFSSKDEKKNAVVASPSSATTTSSSSSSSGVAGTGLHFLTAEERTELGLKAVDENDVRQQSRWWDRSGMSGHQSNLAWDELFRLVATRKPDAPAWSSSMAIRVLLNTPRMSPLSGRDALLAMASKGTVTRPVLCSESLKRIVAALDDVAMDDLRGHLLAQLTTVSTFRLMVRGDAS